MRCNADRTLVPGLPYQRCSRAISCCPSAPRNSSTQIPMEPNRCCDAQFHLDHSLVQPSLRAACTPGGCPPCARFDGTRSTREMTLAWRPHQYRRRVKVCVKKQTPVPSPGTRQLPPKPRVNDRRASSGHPCRCRRRVGHRSRCSPTSCDRHCHDSIQHGVITILWCRGRKNGPNLQLHACIPMP